VAASLHPGDYMGDKVNRESLAALREPAPALSPRAGLPDHLRCSVCERPLIRILPDGRSRSIMMRCPHCGALQHRHL